MARKKYPFNKDRSDLDSELPDGADDAIYLSALCHHLSRVWDQGDFDLTICLPGADSYVGDTLGRLHVSQAGLAERDAFVLEACRRRNLPLTIAMAGGYAETVSDTVTIHHRTMQLTSSYARR